MSTRFLEAVDGSNDPRYLHHVAYKKWKHSGIKTLSKEEVAILRKHAFKPPASLAATPEEDKPISHEQVSNDQDEIMALLEVAKLSHSRGDVAEAEEALRSVLVHEPRCLPAMLHLGLILLFSKPDLKEAETLYIQAVVAFPRSPLVMSHLGLLEHARGQNQKAEEYYRKAIMTIYEGPLNKCSITLPALTLVCADAYVELGILLEEAYAHHECAEALFRKAIAVDKHCIRGLYRLGVLLHYVKHEYPEAEETYRQIIELDPRHTNALTNLGVLLCTANDRFDEAQKLYERALEVDPEDSSALFLLATMLEDSGECGQALTLYNLALGRKPEAHSESDDNLNWNPDPDTESHGAAL